MSRSPTFRFRSTLYVDLAPGHAYDLLEDVAAYSSWWPQVRSVAKLDEDTALVAARSLLPYTLHFALSPNVRDRAAGTLEAASDGDLVGVCRWDITGTGGATPGVRAAGDHAWPGPAVRGPGSPAGAGAQPPLDDARGPSRAGRLNASVAKGPPTCAPSAASLGASAGIWPAKSSASSCGS